MAHFVYPISFAFLLFGLLLWSLLHDSRGARIGVWLLVTGAIGWIWSMIAIPSLVQAKAAIAFRDLIVLGVAGLLMAKARENRIAAITVLLGAALAFKWSYLDILRSSFDTQNTDIEYADKELLVELDSKENFNLLDQALAPYGVLVEPAFMPASSDITSLDEYYTIDIEGEASDPEISNISKVLNESPFVNWFEPNERISVDPSGNSEVTPEMSSDHMFTNDPDLRLQWSMQALDIKSLHDVLNLKTVQRGKQALIAILDTGVDGMHEDLRSSYQSTLTKYDVDRIGHGTHVAGIVAAVSNNHLGVTSFAPSPDLIKITSIKVLNNNGFGSQQTIISGMIEAADLGADVISMSLGGRANKKKERAYENAVKYCNEKGAIVVVAAGNSSTSSEFQTPANVSGVITVTAIGSDMKLARFSNWLGPNQKYGLAAPGDNIHSTLPGNRYGAQRGTSMACPHVSSIIAIMRCFEPNLDTEMAHRILYETGYDSHSEKESGHIIRPADALRYVLD